MQATTMTDINQMATHLPDATLVGSDDIDSLEDVTTAPQQPLDHLDSSTPQQPTGDQTPKAK